jgi:hypothetical protein
MEALKPYAKAIVALVIPLIGLAVTLGFFDPSSGEAITAAVVAVATGLGVYEVANRPSISGRTPS